DSFDYFAHVRRHRFVIKCQEVAQGGDPIASSLDQLFFHQTDGRGIVVAQQSHDRVFLEHDRLYNFAAPAARLSIFFNDAEHFARAASKSERDWAAADAAIFDQRMVALRGIDLQGEDLATMRTRHVDLSQQIHRTSPNRA